jgi:hypothetical protein
MWSKPVIMLAGVVFPLSFGEGLGVRCVPTSVIPRYFPLCLIPEFSSIEKSRMCNS